MVEPIQTNVLAKVVGLLIKPVVYVVRIFTDQPRLNVLFPRSTAPSKDTAWIFEQSPGVGLFYFGITTTTGHEVEIVEVSLFYEAPLEFKNPGQDVFFQPHQSPDPHRPFGLGWRGSTIVTTSLIQTFGVEAHFHDEIKVRDVLLVIKARRRVPEVGGFELERRNKRTSRIVRLNLTSEPPQGLLIPQSVSSQSPQAFMRRAPRELIGDPNVVRLDYIDQDGRPRSRLHNVPGPEPRE